MTGFGANARLAQEPGQPRAMPSLGVRVPPVLNPEETAMPEVYVHAIEGRSIEQKRALVQDITEAVVRHFNVKPDAVMVEIMEARKDLKAKGGFLFCDRPPG